MFASRMSDSSFSDAFLALLSVCVVSHDAGVGAHLCENSLRDALRINRRYCFFMFRGLKKRRVLLEEVCNSFVFLRALRDFINRLKRIDFQNLPLRSLFYKRSGRIVL